MAHHDSLVILSSSPEFPSICDLIPKTTKSPLRNGQHATPIPDGVQATFSSAAEIWQTQRPLGPDHHDVRGPERSGAAATEPLPGAPDKPGRAGGKIGSKRRGKKAATSTELGAVDSMQLPSAEGPATAPANKAARKPRAPRKADTAQTTFPKGKVTKPAAKGGQAKETPETVSKHFAAQDAVSASRPDPGSAPDDDPILLEPAMARRTDWTPPRETATYRPASSAAKELFSSPSPARRNIFETLHDDYGCTADVRRSPPACPDVLGKRKLIETVDAPGRQNAPEQLPAQSLAKPKAAKKKPRTITELATAAYRLPEASGASPGGSREGSAPGDSGSAAPRPDTATTSQTGTKGRNARKPSKPKATAAKKKAPPKPQLLSPNSAMRQAAQQDFVFGTASQLAAEDDPELLRALHEAMKASNQPDGDPFVSSTPVVGNLAIRRKGGGGLWAASARFDGGVVDLEVLDLTRSSPVSLVRAVGHDAANHEEPGQPDEGAFVDIDMSDGCFQDSNTPPAHPASPGLPSALPAVPEIVQIHDSSPFVPDRPETPPLQPEFEPPPSNQEQLLLSQPNSTQLQPPPRPRFELYTDARLAREVASYGFQAIKKRDAAIALLTKCWESQHNIGPGSTASRSAMSTTAANAAGSPKRRGRPKKGAESTLVSEPSQTTSNAHSTTAPETPRRRGRPKKTCTLDAAAPPPAPPGDDLSAGTAHPEPEPAKKPRGRPRKDAAAPATKPSKKASSSPRSTTTSSRSTRPPVIEIPDSDLDDSVPSTPSSSHSPRADEDDDDMFSSPPAIDLSLTQDLDSASANDAGVPTSREEELLRSITQAVITAPRSADASDPSWHEKMLMYDPVILEDLTAWLNAGQLDRVGYGGAVSPAEVKKWCESKSVCCLWKENLRGRERKRL
ncbi:hypothetical protein VTJ83DRAFT_136 [Remersonia thermophila]|uniref:Structure-specific endonuclease subunit SLX4 n=1 Tax=Remersonia thermophila TaxID=72144 RepID=A0ABR4DKT1_9PEZI